MFVLPAFIPLSGVDIQCDLVLCDGSDYKGIIKFS